MDCSNISSLLFPTAGFRIGAYAIHLLPQHLSAVGRGARDILRRGVARRKARLERRESRPEAPGSALGSFEHGEERQWRERRELSGNIQHLPEDIGAARARRQARQSPRLVPAELDETQIAAPVRGNIRHSQVRGGPAVKRRARQPTTVMRR